MRPNVVSREASIQLGREYWEHEYKKLLQNRESAIRGLMADMKGMESDAVLEDFATLQVDSFIRGYQQWIDETFPKEK